MNKEGKLHFIGLVEDAGELSKEFPEFRARNGHQGDLQLKRGLLEDVEFLFIASI